jgi:tRNA(Ile)-lysidine synthase
MPIRKTSDKLSFLDTRVLGTIRAHAMVAPGDCVLVAVSGGPDSMALLQCLHALVPILDCSLTVAHLNHGLRGEEADGDEAFVRETCAALGIPFVSEAVDVKKRAAAAKENLEQAGRECRYEFLRRAAREAGAQKIAVGHNSNDQAETALFRFLRGSGLEGLSAIHPVVNGCVIRPLLECTREQILAYLEWRKCAYREDSSNRDLRYSRNRIRWELVPYLEKHFNPRLGRTLAREVSLMRESWDFIRLQAQKLLEGKIRSMEDGIALKISAIGSMHPALQKEVLRCALQCFRGNLKGIARVHIESILYLCLQAQSGERILLPQNNVAIRQFDELLLLHREFEPVKPYRYELEVPGSCYVAEAAATFRAEICDALPGSAGGDGIARAYLDPSVLQYPLVIRSRAPGDRYGGAGHRKVKKMLIDGKIPLSRRDLLPMVVSGGAVAWIPGFKPAKSFGSRDPGKPCVRIECFPDAS